MVSTLHGFTVLLKHLCMPILDIDGFLFDRMVAVILFNPNSIGVKYFLIVLGGDYLHHVSVLTSILVNSFLLQRSTKNH